MKRIALLGLVAIACGKDAAPAPVEASAAPVEAAVAVDLDAQAAADRAKRIAQARADLDAGTWSGPELYATSIRTSVMNVPAWPPDADAGAPPSNDVYRLGYIRHGAHVPVFPDRIVNDACPEGWLELLEGGFVCGKYASLDPKDPAVKFAANPPDLAGPMPYRYGLSLADNTPVYRRVLALADRIKYEPWLAPHDDDEDAGAEEPDDAGPKEIVKLHDLRGRGVLARKMMKGFYVAIDRDFKAAKARWWRTAEGFAIPYERLMIQNWTPSFHGSWVVTSDEARDGGVGAEGDAGSGGNGTAALVRTLGAMRFHEVAGSTAGGTAQAPDAKGKLVYYGTPLPKWTALELGDPRTEGGVVYRATSAGFFVRELDLLIATPEPPKDLADGEKWIDVDLDKQMLVAFEGKRPVYATRVSSGKSWSWDPDHNYATPTGTFRINAKHVSVTMDGDIAADGPYSIEDVPWVMYFQGSYALHGAFWHNFFGTTRSHGCVNLSPTDAHELFFWTEPRLPRGWHGVFETPDHPGTRVVIHQLPKPKK